MPEPKEYQPIFARSPAHGKYHATSRKVIPRNSMNRILQTFDITGARALVTGGGSGLGRAMALTLRDAGADVAIVGTL